MWLKNKFQSQVERRKYIRLDTVLPVQFRLATLDDKRFLSAWTQGFTSNISRGGISLAVRDLPEDLFKLLQERKIKIALEIELPLARNPIRAEAAVAWMKIVPGLAQRALIGLDYKKINLNENKKLLRFAHFKQLFLPVVILIIGALILALALGIYSNRQLSQQNKFLINELISVTQEAHLAKEKLKNI